MARVRLTPAPLPPKPRRKIPPKLKPPRQSQRLSLSRQPPTESDSGSRRLFGQSPHKTAFPMSNFHRSPEPSPADELPRKTSRLTSPPARQAERRSRLPRNRSKSSRSSRL